MRLGDTIAAIATAPGRSRRAMLRLSGPAAHGAAKALGVVLPAPIESHRPRCAVVGVRMGASELPALCVVSFASRSFTGEDTVELIVPGQPHLTQRLLRDLIETPGVRHAEPGEFTARAFLNGRMSVDEAEAVGALIGARNAEELAAAHRLRSGEPGREAMRWLEEAATLLALVESGIDFTDQEDVVPISAQDLRARLEALAQGLSAALGPRRVREALAPTPRVALVGAPNAGKSTLFNGLLGRSRAVTSDQPGTTRDALEETLDLSSEAPGAGVVTLVDLAGLDEALHARSAPDSESQRLAQRAIERCDVALLCDPTGSFELADSLPSGAAVIRLRTKADLPREGSAGPALEVCGLDGRGLGALRRAIADSAFASEARGASEAALGPRRRAALERALSTVEAAASSVGGAEITAHSLREAVDALGELAGRVHPDDIIGRIFATFCIGK